MYTLLHTKQYYTRSDRRTNIDSHRNTKLFVYTLIQHKYTLHNSVHIITIFEIYLKKHLN